VNAHDRLREAIQGLLNESGDGFILAHYVVVLGIQRVNAAGEIVSAAWVASPKDQATGCWRRVRRCGRTAIWSSTTTTS